MGLVAGIVVAVVGGIVVDVTGGIVVVVTGGIVVVVTGGIEVVGGIVVVSGIVVPSVPMVVVPSVPAVVEAQAVMVVPIVVSGTGGQGHSEKEGELGPQMQSGHSSTKSQLVQEGTLGRQKGVWIPHCGICGEDVRPGK